MARGRKSPRSDAFGRCFSATAHPSDGVSLREVVRHEVTPPDKGIEPRPAVVARLRQPSPPAADQHVDVRGGQLPRDRRHVTPISDMGVEGPRRRMLEGARHHDARRQTFGRSPCHRRFERNTRRIDPQRSVVGLAARRQRRRRRRGVRDPVVRRAGHEQRNLLRPVEGRRGVVVPDLQHRNLRKAHAVADHQNKIPNGFRVRIRVRRARQQEAQHECQPFAIHGSVEDLSGKNSKNVPENQTFCYLYPIIQSVFNTLATWM